VRGHRHRRFAGRRWARFAGRKKRPASTPRHPEALYREGTIEISEATRVAELLPAEKDLDSILRQERMLELEY